MMRKNIAIDLIFEVVLKKSGTNILEHQYLKYSAFP